MPQPLQPARAPIRRRGRAKLTMLDADVIRMEAASEKPPSQRSQAKRFGVSQMAIWQVLAGRTFRKEPTK